MRASLPISVILHGGAVAAVLYGVVPSAREDLYIPPVPIEVISEAELSELLSVPEMVTEEPPAEIEPEVIEPEILPKPEPEPETPVAEPEPEPLPVEPEPEPEPTPPEPEPEPVVEQPKPQPQPKPQEDELDFAALADSLVDLDPDKQERDAPSQIRQDAIVADRNQERIGTGAELTIREEDLFRARMYECWNPDLGVPNASDLFVEVRITLNRDGTLATAPTVLNDGQINRSGNGYWRAARTRALTAVQQCAPYNFLDPARYDNWRVVVYNFDPDEL